MQENKNHVPLNPLNLSPIDIDRRNGRKNLVGQYSKSSPIKCAFLIIWVKSNTHIHWWIVGKEIKLYWGSKYCKKKTNWKILRQKEVTNQKGSKTCYKIKRELPKVRAQSMTLHFNMVSTTWNPHSLLDNIEHKPKKKSNRPTSFLRCRKKYQEKNKACAF